MKTIDEAYEEQRSEDMFEGLNKKADFSNTKQVVEKIKKFRDIIRRMKPKSMGSDDLLTRIKNATKEELKDMLNEINNNIKGLQKDKAIIEAILKTKE